MEQAQTQREKQRSRRRRLVIDKEVQTRIIYRITWVPLGCLIVAVLAMAFLCEQARTAAMAVGIEIPGILQSFVVAELLIMMCAVFLLRNSLVVSHRLAGPQYRFRQTFKRFMDGEHEARNRLRKHDFLRRTEVDINKFLGWVQNELENGESTETREPETDEQQPASAEHSEELAVGSTTEAD